MNFIQLKRAARTALILVFLSSGSSLIATQVMAETDRDDLFDQLLQDPGNQTLMLQYAKLSIEARDYEAAIATLERVLDQDPQAQEARFALAKAYFALGADAVAQYHLSIYTQRAQLTQAETAEAEAFIKASDARQKRLTFDGYIALGAVRRTDLGETGLSYSAGLGLHWDMGGAIAQVWRTQLRLDGYRFSDAPANDTTQFLLRTGPVLSLDGLAFGARLQPYLEARIIDDDDPADEGQTLLLGAHYTNTLTAQWAVFADLGFGRTNRDQPATDADVTRLLIGATWRPTTNTTLRLSSRWQDEAARDGGIDRERIGARLDASVSFASNWSNIGKEWRLSGFVQVDQDEYGNGREDDLTAYGVALRGYLTENAFWTLSASKIKRDSTTAAFDEDDTLIGLQAGWEF